eukprot:m.106117 g.106117  ORF g.106117 m.106117 type:complete len:73 (+) comp15757_c1_seq1:190-408(+)
MRLHHRASALFYVSWLLVATAPWHHQVSASALTPRQDGFIGLDEDNNMVLEAPANGRVLVGGVDCPRAPGCL